jgi:hypothetical protein
VFPHDYKRVLGIPRYQPARAETHSPQVVPVALKHQEAAHG